jgi:tetratricopeptide (TPR) repeat protein
MKRINLLFLCLLLHIAPALKAQMPSIQIKGEKNATVDLKSMDIDVEIFGNVAITTMKMVFHNNTSRILEGELTFPMPEGVTVSRYAIDINGKLRDAVPVPKAKATEVFESIEHRQIDPGILERVEGNNFRTRIYPLPANGERTVLIAYEEALAFKNGNAMQYHLPLNYPQRISTFSLQAKVYQGTQKPQLLEQPDGSFTFSENNQTYEASLRKTDYKPQKSLTVSLPKNTSIPEVVLQPNRDGSYYFLVNAYQKGNSQKKVWSNRMGIIWDNSLSGIHRDKEKELALLDLIIKQKQNLTVELGLLNITFKKAQSFTIKNGDWSELKKYLQNLVYDGGTDFSAVNEKTLPADEYLFFSEGLSTFGKNTVAISKPVYCITSSTKADYSALKAISNKTGGKFVNLQNTPVNEAYQTINEDNLQFLGIQEQSLVSEVYPSAPAEINGHISVAGIIKKGSGEITLLFGRNGKIESTQKVQLKNQSGDIKVNRIWAQKKIAEMDVQYEQNKEDIELLGKQFGIVTRNTSLIVLEDIADYVRYEITPPAELLSTYNELKKNQWAAKENRMNELLERAFVMVEDLKVWWKTDFKPGKRYPTPIDDDGYSGIIAEEEMDISVQADMPPPPPPAQSVHPEILNIVEDDAEIDEILITSSEDVGSLAQAQDYVVAEAEESSAADYRRPANRTKIKESKPTETRQIAKIRLPGIQSDKEYMQQIRSANDPYSSYLALRETYMGTPGFYFDVSDFFYEKNQTEKGLLILSNLADLDIENAELFKTLAYRLKEKGAYKHELYITQKVREWRPMDPQSHRDYALALQDNGQYQEALECLYSILNASYSPEAAIRDYGIEETLVCEINNLISLHRKKLNLSMIDSRLIADLPVNIRVVINWNKNDTDIDLWVTDPNGERCYYSHNRTTIGGRLSNDFTQGFGPEQFLLKKAINGTYKIETNFFGERQLTLSGPTTIMGEIYLYYSDGREERQIITFQNGENGRETNGVLIGEFEFSDKAIAQTGNSTLFKKTGTDETITEEELPSTADNKKQTIPWAIGICCLGGLLMVFTKKNR